MTEVKNTNLEFLQKLFAAETPMDLFKLAQKAINDSHDHRSFALRQKQDLFVNSNSISLNARIALQRAKFNANLSTNDKLYMIMQRYIDSSLEKAPKLSKDKVVARFCTEFAHFCPREYGLGNNPAMFKYNGR